MLARHQSTAAPRNHHHRRGDGAHRASARNAHSPRGQYVNSVATPCQRFSAANAAPLYNARISSNGINGVVEMAEEAIGVTKI